MATLPQTHVFELSQQSSDSVKQNGEYTVHFAEPITMQPGDQLSMRMASIDSQRSDSNSIILPLDGTNSQTNVSMRFSYYDVNYPVPSAQKYEYDKVPTANKTADFLPYSAYDVQRIAEVQSVVVTGRMLDDDRISINLPFQATFTAIPLFTWVDLSGNHQHTPTGGDPGFPTPSNNDPYQYKGSALIQKNNVNDTDITCLPTNKKIEFQQGTLQTTGFILEWSDPQFLPTLLRDNFSLKATNTADVATGPINMKFGTAGFTIDPGRYDRETLAVKLTQGFNLNGLDPTVYDIDGTDKNLFLSDTALVINTQQPLNNGLLFHLMPTQNEKIDLSQNNSYVYADPDPASTNPIPFLNVGARKLAIEYGQVGETFQLSAAHQSVDNPADPGNENVAFFATGGGNENLFSVPRATGIIIHDLEPRALWDDVMGLYDNVIVPLQTDVSGLSYVLRKDLDKTPKESAEISVFTPKNNRGPGTTLPTTAAPVYINTSNTPTTAVIGNSPRVNQSGGYFLVEITGLNTAQSNFVDNETNRPNISAIVSTQYDNNDIVTGFADSAIQYVHRGAPTAIASAKVRILDPLTKEVVPTLGEANSIFLDLVSQAPVYQPPQRAPSSDKDQKSKS